MLLHCCRCCPQLCEASVTAGLPDVLLRSACTSGSSTATLSLLVLAEVVSGVAAAADAVAAGQPLPGSTAADAAADAVRQCGSDRQQGRNQHAQPQQQRGQQEQWQRARRQHLAAALQALRPSQTTDSIIERLSGELESKEVMYAAPWCSLSTQGTFWAAPGNETSVPCFAGLRLGPLMNNAHFVMLLMLYQKLHFWGHGPTQHLLCTASSQTPHVCLSHFCITQRCCTTTLPTCDSPLQRQAPLPHTYLCTS
jgi:hypothetical protein